MRSRPLCSYFSVREEVYNEELDTRDNCDLGGCQIGHASEYDDAPPLFLFVPACALLVCLRVDEPIERLVADLFSLAVVFGVVSRELDDVDERMVVNQVAVG